jgi:hypothetical protein
VAGSFGGATFNWVTALAGLTLAVALSLATLVGAARLVPGSVGALEAATSLARALVGLPATRWEVADGRLAAHGPRHGEAILTVPDGWVVATKREGQFSRLVTSRQGVVRLGLGEEPHRAVPCHVVTATGTVEQALTRDAVQVAAVEWHLEAQIRSKSGEEPRPGEPYPYDPYAVRQAAWGPDDLEAAVRSVAAEALLSAIREAPMSALFDPAGSTVPMLAALEPARRQLETRLLGWGFGLRGLQLTRVTLSDDIQDHLTAVWHAKTERQVRAIARETELAARATPAAVWALDPSPNAPEPAAASAGPESAGDSGETPSAGEIGALVSAFEGSLRGRRKSRNPVSFGQFLGTLRQRAESGDDTAGSVLRQVMDVMSRLEPGQAGSRRAATSGAGDALVGAGAGGDAGSQATGDGGGPLAGEAPDQSRAESPAAPEGEADSESSGGQKRLL